MNKLKEQIFFLIWILVFNKNIDALKYTQGLHNVHYSQHNKSKRRHMYYKDTTVITVQVYHDLSEAMLHETFRVK